MVLNLEELSRNLTPEQRRQLKEDRLYLEQFTAQCNVSLLGITENDECFPLEGLSYRFDDNLGGYSIGGIKGSLEENKVMQRLNEQ